MSTTFQQLKVWIQLLALYVFKQDFIVSLLAQQIVSVFVIDQIKLFKKQLSHGRVSSLYYKLSADSGAGKMNKANRLFFK